MVLFFHPCVPHRIVYVLCMPGREGTEKKKRTGHKLCEQAIQCTLFVCVNDKLLFQFPLYSLVEWHFTPCPTSMRFFLGASICFRTNFFFIRVCVREPKLLLLLFPKKMGFCQSKKSPATNTLFRTREIRFYVDLTWLLNNTLADSFCLSLSLLYPSSTLARFESMRMSHLQSDQLANKKRPHKKRQTHGEIFDKVMRQNIGPSMYNVHVCAYVFYAPSF